MLRNVLILLVLSVFVVPKGATEMPVGHQDGNEIRPVRPDLPQWEEVGMEDVLATIESSASAGSSSCQQNGRNHHGGSSSCRSVKTLSNCPGCGCTLVYSRLRHGSLAMGNPTRPSDYFVFFIGRLRL